MKKKLFTSVTRTKALLLIAAILISFSVWRAFMLNQPHCQALINSHYFDYATNAYISDKSIIVKSAAISDIIDANSTQQVDLNCRLIDLKGAYLYPGLIDSHTHLLALDKQRVSDWKSALELSAARPETMRLDIGAMNARSMLMAGFTTVRDLGNSGYYLDEKLKSKIDNKISMGPDIIISGPGITIAPSQINLKINAQEYTVVDEKTDIHTLLRGYKSHNVTWVKLYADNSGQGSLITQNLLNKLTAFAQSLDLKVAIHAELSQSIINALDANANSIEHFYEIPDAQIKKIKYPFITLTESSLKTCLDLSFSKSCATNVKLLKGRVAWLKDNGFKYVFGSDAVLDFTSNFKTRGDASLSSLISLGEFGLSPLEVVLSATAAPSMMLGQPIGKIKKNFTANFVAFHSDPLINLENLKTRNFVMFKGVVICNSQDSCEP